MIYVDETSKLGDFISDLIKCKLIGFDLETSGLDAFVDIISLAQFSLDGKTYVFNVVKLGVKFLKYLVMLVNDQETPKTVIGHNLKFDLRFLEVYVDEQFKLIHDTSLAEDLILKGLVKNNYFTLAELAEKYCGIILDKELQSSFVGNTTGEFTQEQLDYASKDVSCLFEIYHKQVSKLKEQGQFNTLQLEMDVEPAFVQMEITGVGMNKERWLSFLEPAKRKLKESSDALIDYFLANVSLRKYSNAFELMTALGYPKTKLKTKKVTNLLSSLGRESFEELLKEKLEFSSSKQSTAFLQLCGVNVDASNEKELNGHLEKDVVKLLLRYRENAKKCSTYGEEYFKHIHPKTGKIHTTLNQNRSNSGRVASSDPCLTQIPSELGEDNLPTYRGCIIPDKGYKFIDLDYSGQELRISAHAFNEPKLKLAFKDGVDVHSLTASLMYKKPIEEVTKAERFNGKRLNFSILYGVSAWGLYRNFGFGKEEAEELLNNFWEGYADMYKSVQAMQKLILKYGFSVSLNGRKRFFEMPDRFSLGTEEYDRRLAAIMREGVNNVIQSTAADTTKTAIKYVYQRNPFGKDLRLVLSVHDEILCMAKEEIAEEALKFVKECMLEAEQLFLGDVPAKVDGGIFDYWGH